MVLRFDGNSEHVAHVLKKTGLFWNEFLICNYFWSIHYQFQSTCARLFMDNHLMQVLWFRREENFLWFCIKILCNYLYVTQGWKHYKIVMKILKYMCIYITNYVCIRIYCETENYAHISNIFFNSYHILLKKCSTLNIMY